MLQTTKRERTVTYKKLHKDSINMLFYAEVMNLVLTKYYQHR